MEEASQNLSAPEIAPAEEFLRVRRHKPRTRRTVQFNTKVTPEFESEFWRLCIEKDITAGSMLEILLNSYKERN
jgi:hypothetical protein